MSRTIDRFIKAVNSINDWVGYITAFLLPIIILIVSYEVTMRYFFNSPTIWAWDVNIQLFAIMVFLGGGYTLMQNGHVRVDLWYGKLSPRGKAKTDVITAPLFFLFFTILLWKGGEMTLDSIAEREVMSTILAPPLYPLKIIFTTGVFLFFLQGVVQLILDLRAAFSKAKPS
jgi:TRAP-type mannitol/chloroaromatic compound transport system permease small subunit